MNFSGLFCYFSRTYDVWILGNDLRTSDYHVVYLIAQLYKTLEEKIRVINHMSLVFQNFDPQAIEHSDLSSNYI